MARIVVLRKIRSYSEEADVIYAMAWSPGEVSALTLL